MSNVVRLISASKSDFETMTPMALKESIYKSEGRVIMGQHLLFALRTLDPLKLCHKVQILLHDHFRVERRLLRQVADEPLGRAGLLENVVPVDAHTPACGGQAASYDVHGGGLSCAVWPQEAVDMPLLDFKGEIVHRQEISITLCQVFHCDHG